VGQQDGPVRWVRGQVVGEDLRVAASPRDLEALHIRAKRGCDLRKRSPNEPMGRQRGRPARGVLTTAAGGSRAGAGKKEHISLRADQRGEAGGISRSISPNSVPRIDHRRRLASRTS
jgi:hypothetical protein